MEKDSDLTLAWRSLPDFAWHFVIRRVAPTLWRTKKKDGPIGRNTGVRFNRDVLEQLPDGATVLDAIRLGEACDFHSQEMQALMR